MSETFILKVFGQLSLQGAEHHTEGGELDCPMTSNLQSCQVIFVPRRKTFELILSLLKIDLNRQKLACASNPPTRSSLLIFSRNTISLKTSFLDLVPQSDRRVWEGSSFDRKVFNLAAVYPMHPANTLQSLRKIGLFNSVQTSLYISGLRSRIGNLSLLLPAVIVGII